MLSKKQIAKMEVFKDVSVDTIDKVMETGKVLEVKKGTLLMRMKENVSNVYFQISGKSIAYHYTSQGRRKIFFVFGKGRMLNTDVFNAYSNMNYETIESSEFLCISVKEYEELLKKDFVLVKNTMLIQNQRTKRLSRQLRNTVSGISVEKKLLSKLWKLAKDFGISTNEGIEIDMNLSVTFLADMLGLPRETTSRACSLLVKNELISIVGKRITIKNPDALKEMYNNEKRKNVK